MEPAILQPFLNPVKLHRIEPVQIARYVSKFFLDYFFIETVREWEDPKKPYYQPFMRADTITLQLQANINPIQIYLIRCDESIAYSNAFTQKQQYGLDPSWHIYEHTLPLALIPEGVYFIQVVAGTINLISEPLKIQNVWENSVLLEYQHYRFYGDVIFETGINFSLRVHGSIGKYITPASKDTTYEDQSLNLTMIHSVPYRVVPLLIGDAGGIPDYLIDKINRILGCSSLQIEGRYYTKGGTQLEPKALEDYRMRGWSIDMRERYNRHSQIDEGDATMTGVVMIAAASDTKGFGVTDGGDSVLTDAI